MMVMIFRQCILCSLLAGILFSLPASASSLWQGPYVGAYVGGGLGDSHLSTDVGSVTNASYFTTAADINAINNAGSWSKEPSTLLAGIQAGHDWTWQQIVYGIAFDYSTLPLSSSSSATNSYADNSGQYSVYTSMQTNWLFTLRGRVGYQSTLYLPNFLYFTGGIAMTQLKVNNSFNDNSAFAGITSSHTAQNQIGWTAGVGIEVAAYQHVSVDFEYLYVNVPSVKTVGAISNTQGGFGIPVNSMTSPFTTTADFHANVFKVGVNYRFGE